MRPKPGAAPSVPKSPWIQINAQPHPELRVPDGSFTASGNGGERLTVIPQIETLVVNLMNTDGPGPRMGTADDRGRGRCRCHGRTERIKASR